MVCTLFGASQPPKNGPLRPRDCYGPYKTLIQEILGSLFEQPWCTTHRAGRDSASAPAAQTGPPICTRTRTHTRPPPPESHGTKPPPTPGQFPKWTSALAPPRNAFPHLLCLANSYLAFMAPTHKPSLGRSLWAALGKGICVFVPPLMAGLGVDSILQDCELPEFCGLGPNRCRV